MTTKYSLLKNSSDQFMLIVPSEQPYELPCLFVYDGAEDGYLLFNDDTVVEIENINQAVRKELAQKEAIKVIETKDSSVISEYVAKRVSPKDII